MDDVYILVYGAISALSKLVLLFRHNLGVRLLVAPLIGRFQAVHREELGHGLRVLDSFLGRRLIDKSVSKGFGRGELVDACVQPGSGVEIQSLVGVIEWKAALFR